jgi:hypothetical protein
MRIFDADKKEKKIFPAKSPGNHLHLNGLNTYLRI